MKPIRMTYRTIYIILFALPLLFVCTSGTAQQLLKGKVLELGSNEVMPQVDIKNLASGVVVGSDRNGDFSIAVKSNEILVFSFPGYRTDSLVVTDFAFKRVYLTGVDDPRLLSEVNVTAMTNSRLEEERAKAQSQGQVATTVSGGGIALSPSRMFGKEGRNARRSYRLMEEEASNRDIDARFTPALVQSFTPLKGEDLELFMVNYRPKVNFIKKATDDDLRLYVIDSYGKFNKLTEAQKKKIKLETDQK
ncbi:hypothetical protein [Olivibacter sitiensis]|uniref:hypothetical protein n=1 Tax=Olivibacter sitiensis TaxID=376470 RepID=UPI000488D05E|nr:hypothetical protein [Olivibacter sitiensis]